MNSSSTGAPSRGTLRVRPRFSPGAVPEGVPRELHVHEHGGDGITLISISIVNSMFVSTGPIESTENSPSGGMALFNNLFNLPEVMTVRMGGRMEMWGQDL